MKLLQKIFKIVPLVLLVLNFPEMQEVHGQDQIQMADYLRQKFHRYCERVPREEVFVSSDREEYIAGEELWFKIWEVDRKSSRLSSESKIGYLELLNPDNTPVAQSRIYISNGTGQGRIELPDTLTTGTYTLRAYTNWMKNFLPDNCFYKEINIYNISGSGFFKRKEYIPDERKAVSGKNNGLGVPCQWLTCTVNNRKPDTLEIFIQADKKYLTVENTIFYLFIQTRGNMNFAGFERIAGGSTKISVPKSILIPGINQIVLFDFHGQPVCERYIYTPEKGERKPSILSADSFGTRSKVSLGLTIDGSLSDSLISPGLNVSVVPASGSNSGMELHDFLIFGSEFGLLPGKVMKGKRIDELPRELTDSLLLQIKSNWINWESILSDTLPEFSFRIENEYHYLSGTLSTSDHRPAAPGEFLLLSVPGKVPLFQYALSNKEGKFSFNLHMDEPMQDWVIQPDDIGKNYKMYLESSFSDRYLPSGIRSDLISKPLPSRIVTMGLNYQVGKIYGTSYAGNPFNTPGLSPVYPKRFYGKPDAEIMMKDWVKLPVMEEVFFEIVPYVTLKKKGSGYEIMVVDPLGKIRFDKPPVMMIDGVILKDPGFLANLNPEIVEKIDVVKEQYIVGDYLFNGIVHVITKSGDFGKITVPDYAIRMQYKIFDSVPVFASPDYASPEMKNSREPDFRNTLYWNPSVKPDKEGKAKIEFWTSDIKSEYVIHIQGITSDGKSISIRKNFHVK